MVTVHQLGRVEYADGLELQRRFQLARRAEQVTDTLLLLEHPPVLTLGRGAKTQNILTPKPMLDAMGVAVFETDRGGDVTYHGPGQLVGYPLLYLPPGEQDVRRYVRNLEETIIRVLADFGLVAARRPEYPGVWILEARRGGPRKICALGVHLSRWYTRHGFALNVEPNLAHFDLIVPCGIRDGGVTSMTAELQRPVSMREVEARVAHHFSEVFEAAVTQAPSPTHTVSVAVRRGAQVLLLQRTEARGGFWQLVTGHVEAGETPAQAATRELHEETGLRSALEPLEYSHSFVMPSGDEATPVVGRETAFVARVPAGADVVRSSEHVAYAWLDRSAALERLPFEGLREAVRRALQ